jgi:VanZ like protein
MMPPAQGRTTPEVLGLNRHETLGRGLTVAALLAIGYCTLTPHPELAERMREASPWCLFRCGDFDLLDMILNVILFVPLGLGLRLWMRRGPALAICLGTTIAIELTQHWFIAGRHGGVRDVFTNTLGSAVGIWLATAWPGILRPGRTVGWWLAHGAALAWLTVLLLTGVLEQPSLPRSIWYGQWAPELGQFDTFPGEVLDAHVNELFLHGGLLPASDTVRDQFAAPSYRLSVTAVTGAAPANEAPVFSIFDHEQREILVLAQAGQSLDYRIRRRATDWGLRPPAARLDLVPPAGPGDTIQIGISSSGPLVDLAARIGDHTIAAKRQITVGEGWALLLPFEYALGGESPWLTALWLGCLLLPAAYWGSLAGVRSIPARLVLLVLIGLAVVPLSLGLLASPWWEWIGALAGALIGWRLGHSGGTETGVSGMGQT